MITITTSSRYKINSSLIKKYAEACLLLYDKNPAALVNIIFVGKRKMTEIASTYKHEHVALPVLAFPYKEHVENESLVGEIFICYPQAVLLAAEREKKVDEMMVQLIEHGIGNLFK